MAQFGPLRENKEQDQTGGSRDTTVPEDFKRRNPRQPVPGVEGEEDQITEGGASPEEPPKGPSNVLGDFPGFNRVRELQIEVPESGGRKEGKGVAPANVKPSKESRLFKRDQKRLGSMFEKVKSSGEWKDLDPTKNKPMARNATRILNKMEDREWVERVNSNPMLSSEETPFTERFFGLDERKFDELTRQFEKEFGLEKSKFMLDKARVASAMMANTNAAKQQVSENAREVYEKDTQMLQEAQKVALEKGGDDPDKVARIYNSLISAPTEGKPGGPFYENAKRVAEFNAKANGFGKASETKAKGQQSWWGPFAWLEFLNPGKEVRVPSSYPQRRSSSIVGGGTEGNSQGGGVDPEVESKIQEMKNYSGR